MESLKKHLKELLKQPGTKILLIRAGESVSNLAGTLAGWTDTKLSEYGKSQASLLYQGLYEDLPQFRGFYTSDLLRARETLQRATLYTVSFEEDERLREIYFGEHEGEHFDSMPEELRDEINSMKYQAPKGENWSMVNRRALNFFKEKCEQQGTYVCSTHGGLICTLTYPFGVVDVLPNASIAGLSLAGPQMKLEFTWTCPEILNR
jgi:broad specificity phosphatase PhoE